jgi:hypothetical protein
MVQQVALKCRICCCWNSSDANEDYPVDVWQASLQPFSVACVAGQQI